MINIFKDKILYAAIKIEGEKTDPYSEYSYAVFCPICHSMHYFYEFFVPININKDINYFKKQDPDYFFQYKYRHVYEKYFKKLNHRNRIDDMNFVCECPDCHADLTKIDTHELIRLDPSKRNSLLYSCDIYKKDDKIVLNASFKDFYPNTIAQKIIISFFNIYITMNLKTGQTFCLGAYKNGKKTSWYKIPLLNITYSKYFLKFDNIYEQIFNNKKISKKLKNILFDNKISLKDNHDINYNYSFNELILLNRFSYFDIDTINKLISYYSDWTVNRLFRKLSGNFDCNSFDFNIILKKFGVPNKKKLKKMASQDISILFLYKIAKKFQFKNYDLLMNLLEDHRKILENFHVKESKLITKIMKVMINTIGEVNTYHKIFSNIMFKDMYSSQDYFYYGSIENNFFAILIDTARGYELILNDKEGSQIDNIKLFKGNLLDIHDRISAQVTKIESRNKFITYSKKEYQLENEFDNIRFILSKDTHTLIDVGSQMKICVGSYKDLAIEKKCTIVLMIKENKYVGCIELRNNRMIQAKAFANKLLFDYKDSLIKWAEENNIITDNCYDYNSLQIDS